jgi:glycosyltransferase involved in cell wall biosynthesis
MKLVHIIPTFYPATAYGGPPEATFRLCEGLGKAGHEVVVVTTNGNGRSTLPATPRGTVVKVGEHVVASYCRRLCRDSVSFSLLGQIVRRTLSSDVVMLSGVYSFPTIPTLLAARLSGKRLLWMPHGSLSGWLGSRRAVAKPLWLGVCKLLLPRSLCFVVASEMEREGVLEHFPNAEVIVAPFGIQIPSGANCRRPRREGKVRLLYVGRLHPIKALENAIEALRILVAAGVDDWVLTIAGAGTAEYERHLKTMVSGAGLSGQVRFTGHVAGEEKDRLFGQSDVLLFPSHKESFGLSVLEGLSYGLIVVAGSGTPWSVLPREKLGMWVENAPPDFARAIAGACALARTTDGEAAVTWVNDKYSPLRCVELVVQHARG